METKDKRLPPFVQYEKKINQSVIVIVDHGIFRYDYRVTGYYCNL
jgi:hypothetical protein